MGILVRAIRLGIYGGQRKREGQEFEVGSEKEIGSWMERVVTVSEPSGPPLNLDPEVEGEVPDNRSPEEIDYDAKKAVADELIDKAAKLRAALKPNPKPTELKKLAEAEAAADEAIEAANAALALLEV